MNRRKLLGFLATVPFVGALIRHGDGVSLTSAAHPRTFTVTGWDELGNDKIETIEIEFPVYARQGEAVVCEEPGHHHLVGFFNEDLSIGDMNWGSKFTVAGGQVQPKDGDMPPLRCLCGARYADESWRFHFLHEGWRDIPQRGGG